jgi:hypothetical protein
MNSELTYPNSELTAPNFYAARMSNPTILRCYTYSMAGIIREISQQYEKSVLSLML